MCSLSAECWCFSCSHYIAKNHRYFLAWRIYFFPNIIFLVKMKFLWYFSAFVSLIPTKVITEAGEFFAKTLHILTFPKSKVTEFVYFVRIFQYIHFCGCVCVANRILVAYFMTCYIHITDTVHGFCADEWFSRVSHQKRIILKCLSRCITDHSAFVKHKIWNCLPTLNANNILSFRRRFYEITHSSYLFLMGNEPKRTPLFESMMKN